MSEANFQLLKTRQKAKAGDHAFRGSGTIWIGDQRFDWTQGDSFVLPPWNWHEHENLSREPALLFSLTDRPAIEVLDFL